LLLALILAVPPAVGAEPAPATAAPPELQLPIRCRPGHDCWLVNLVDLDPGPGVRDYLCRRYTYDGHKGTDIAVRDMRAVAAGVDVVAAAPGVVRGARDGMTDIDVSVAGKDSVKGRECGNGVVIDHGGGWETQYCHMRKGSVVVKRDDKVVAGQKLGSVGHSGEAEFPHLHLSVRHDGQIVDPFVGIGRQANCGLGPKPLWRAEALNQLTGAMTAVFHVGFHDGKPEARDARNGVIGTPALDRAAEALVLWADIYWPDAGDELRLRIVGPDGRPVIDKAATIETTQARRFAFVGKKRTAAAWPAGDYLGEVTLVRDAGKPGERTFKAVASVSVR
jgi:murein DD-endopeptidase MepM/ murein hydrolase activator NlpD